jgi:hypothetical protein
MEVSAVKTANKLMEIYSPASELAGTTSRTDSRARAAHLKALDREKRDAALGEMASQALSPEERIRRWEKLYEASLPKKANHSALAIIAANTGLTLEQVSEEQHRRRSTRRY